MSSRRGLVADTIEFSAVDGPGNRFVVFLQGCTFDCLACHNPYTINPCIDCGECVEPCPTGALDFDDRGRVRWDPTVCTGGDECIRVCRYDSTPKARHLDVSDLLEQIRPAAPFLSGVTVSGGEATMQPGFVGALFTALADDPATRGLTRFIDTNGDASRTVWDELAPVTEGVMVDLKCLDPRIHRDITGGDNDRTLAAIPYLHSLGILHEVRLLLIPGRNDSEALLRATGDWLAQIDPTMRVKVLGYRPHGVRPALLPRREATPEEREGYAAVLGAGRDLRLTVV
ncbi:MAG: YjjW family glycine radical enzyme activase [Micrococcales bacterium]|nr:YjjW family glycine radical enzyme activase [Micrococcales bacterium]